MLSIGSSPFFEGNYGENPSKSRAFLYQEQELYVILRENRSINQQKQGLAISSQEKIMLFSTW